MAKPVDSKSIPGVFTKAARVAAAFVTREKLSWENAADAPFHTAVLVYPADGEKSEGFILDSWPDGRLREFQLGACPSNRTGL